MVLCSKKGRVKEWVGMNDIINAPLSFNFLIGSVLVFSEKKGQRIDCRKEQE